MKRTEVPYPDSLDPQFTNMDTEILKRHFSNALARRHDFNEILPRMDAEIDYRRALEAGECPIYVSPHSDSDRGYGTDKCVECGVSWREHKNIGPGWPQRSNRRKEDIARFEQGVLW